MEVVVFVFLLLLCLLSLLLLLLIYTFMLMVVSVFCLDKKLVGESVDSGTVVLRKRKILDFFLIKFFRYFFFLISLAEQFRSLNKHWQA